MVQQTMDAEETGETYDAVVVGGGPAGACAAWGLARRGRRVLVVERQEFPRFHVGESLLPASNAVFRELGLTERLRDERFVLKRGASFATEDGQFSSYIDFTSTARVQEPVTYQVPRARFDEILLEHAAAAGAEVLQGVRARELRIEENGVRMEVDGRPVHAQVVVDASGQSGFLAKRLRLRDVDPDLRCVALYAHFEGVPRPEGDRSGDIRIVSRRDMGWIWLIPLSESLTSVGLVLPRQCYAPRSEESAEDALERLLAESPLLAEALRGARRVTDVHTAADFSYAPRSYAGDRWLLAGDAGSFLDPVFSSGVLLALESGLEAADAVDRALSAGNVRADAFRDFCDVQRRRHQVFRRMVKGFYDPAFRDLFFHPANHLGILDAIVTLLSGEWRLPFGVRWRLEAFFGLVALQRRIPLSPRYHDRDGTDG